MFIYMLNYVDQVWELSININWKLRQMGIPSRHCLGFDPMMLIHDDWMISHGGTMTSETPDSSRKQSRTLNSILSLGIIISFNVKSQN